MTRGHERASGNGTAVGDTHLRNIVRPALSSILPATTAQRRNRVLASLTVVAAAAGIAAVTATSSDEDRPGSAPAAQDAGPGGGASDDGLALPGSDLDTGTDAPSSTEAPMGDVQRLSEQQQLPSLSSADDAATEPSFEAVTEVTTTSVLEDSDDAGPVYEAVDGELIDAERIFAFLDGRNAPLAAHADTIVAAGVEHDVDPRVVVAIAIAESNGAEMKPPGTHNAWGWGGSGPRGLRAWGSWEESIDDFTARLGSLYDTDNVDWDFASTYCPPNTQWWYDTVTWAMGQI